MVFASSPPSFAYLVPTVWFDQEFDGWETICPLLLSPQAKVQPLLRSRRLVSPSPSMSSDDEPTATNGTTPRATAKAAVAALPAPITSGGGGGGSAPNSAGTGDSPTGPASSSSSFWQSSTLSAEPMSTEAANGTNGTAPPRSRWTKARSTSTESSLSLSGMTTLGSMYNQDGFPNYPPAHTDNGEIAQLAMDDAAIAKQLALTDEAVRSINGTPSVVQARSLGMMGAPSGHTYELPRSMAAFVHPRTSGDDRDLATGRSFVSSGSSTSSEESEHLASVQWVKQVSGPSPSYSPFNTFLDRRSDANPNMPPPTSTRRVASPRRNGQSLPNGPQTQPQGLSLPGGPQHSALPSGIAGDAPGDNDDDDQTVGGVGREGSPSSSSASGLDLLSVAAAHHDRHRYSTSAKRRNGAEAVAQWRESGIPTGTSRLTDVRAGSGGRDSPGYESTPSDGQGRGDAPAEPPKKRRRSELKLEQPDPRLRQITSPTDNGAESEGHSSYEDGSGEDSDYAGKGRKPGVKKISKPAKMRVRAIPVPAAPPSASASNTPPADKKKGRKSSPTPGSAKSAARRLSESSGKAGALGAGVQCEYVNPLPPYQRCPDIFTRKYDIPRHMARHARREGDLVAEGKLSEDKAILWKTIRDKPRIKCKTCGEFFTRQDALKRHQAKQHHH